MRDLARRLWEARRDGHTLSTAAATPPATLEEAYAVQAEIVRLSGHATRGFKVGSTSPEAQRALGTTEPGAGALLAPFVFESPAVVPVYSRHAPHVEGEIAFRLGRDLPARDAPYADREIADAVDAVALAVEIVGTRFEGGLAGKGRLLVTADGGVNIALVTGPWRRDWRDLDLPGLPVAMIVDGVTRGTGTGARALGSPFNVLRWLVERQSRLGRGLAAGEVVSTGTCTGLDPVAPGSRIVCESPAAGPVEITLVEAGSR
jgi:2-keto-4-pentenoate hydratase